MKILNHQIKNNYVYLLKLIEGVKKKKKKKKRKCIVRESNTGLVDGNDEFYH